YTDSLNTKNEIYFELRERVRFHLEIEKNQSRLKVQIIELLHQTFPGLEKLFKNRYSMIALNIAEMYSHPSFVQQQDIDTLISNIFNSTEKGLSTRKAENYAD
ncbi:IS110 family transposase, partial [Staphylococcus haemolyticus]|nr:IS110 family transposase [Staphylococcus haemolyticus]